MDGIELFGRLVALGFSVYEANDTVRRSRQAATEIRELANGLPSASTVKPLKATPLPEKTSAETVAREGLDPKTLQYQDGEIWDHLWLLEGHLKGGCKDCSSDLGCCMKHSGGIAALAKETQSMTTDPKYQEVIEFASEVFWKSQVEDIIAGTYAEDYPALAVRASELRRRFKKVLPPPAGSGITLEEAKAEAAELAAQEIERQWASTEKT